MNEKYRRRRYSSLVTVVETVVAVAVVGFSLFVDKSGIKSRTKRAPISSRKSNTLKKGRKRVQRERIVLIEDMKLKSKTSAESARARIRRSHHHFKKSKKKNKMFYFVCATIQPEQ